MGRSLGIKRIGRFWFEAKWDREGWWFTSTNKIRISHLASLQIARCVDPTHKEPPLLTFILGPLLLLVCDERSIPKEWYDRPTAWFDDEKSK